MKRSTKTLILLKPILAVTISLTALSSHAASPVKVKAEYVYVVSPDETERQAKEKALELARIKAIEDRFGSYISNSTSTMVSNVDGQSTVAVMSLGLSDIAGVWVEKINENTVSEFVNGQHVIRATVVGKAKARELSEPEFEVRTMRFMHDGSLSPSVDFVHEERFDIDFISPVDGYVAVYATDGGNDVYRLLPEPTANIAEPLQVNRGKNYHFSEKNEQVMTLEPYENNAVMRVTVIFNPKKKPFFLPIDKLRLKNNGNLDACVLSQTDYQSWLAKILSDSGTQRRDIFVNIRREP